MRRFLLPLAVLLLGSCRFDASGLLPAADDQSRRDSPGRDTTRPGDGHAALDVHQTAERRPDRAAVDQPLRPDRPASDKPPPKPDLPPPPPACTIGGPTFTFQANMVICASANPGAQDVTACQAPTLCNAAASWHICSGSEYVARGGKTIQPPADNAWLAAYVRSGGGAPFAPKDGFCTDCKVWWDYDADVAWTCPPGSAYTRQSANVWLVTRDACRRVGVNSTATEAYWTISGTATQFGMSSSVCCN